MRQPVSGLTDTVRIVEDPYQEAAVVVVLTEWPDFRAIEWARLAEELDGRIVIDTRNHLDPDMLDRAGLLWRGVGQRAAAPIT
ncbi:UDP binding domain-containing protein [Lentzea sp. E54]|uniref:UDP binding domain-containing protein n=1 Tax=Lentzea xerophila TaxID=3435883 RepID=UPI003DA21F78